jgi:Na+-translocating ferredoxin:NAD+ oxidoreductase RnfG subunit
VRAVYVGAATRIREVASVERQHAVLQIAEDGALHDDLADDEHNVDDDDVGDEDVDDDDVDDDDLDVATDDDAPSGGRVA